MSNSPVAFPGFIFLFTDEPGKESHTIGMNGGTGNDIAGTALQVNDSVAAILHNVPPGLHKFLTAKPKNVTRGELFVWVLGFSFPSLRFATLSEEINRPWMV